MASITIRDIPDELFEQLREIAKEDRRSLNAEVIEVIENAVQQRALKTQRLRALAEIARIRTSQPPSSEEETLTILREGRRQ